MFWFPLCNYTHYSLLKGFSKPHSLAKKCSEDHYKACGIADYKSISGAVSFYKACINEGVKPIIGCSFDDFTLFAKNKNGWFDLIEIISSLDSDNELDTKTLLNVCKRENLISIAKDEASSPINGEDFYEKSASLMDIFYTNKEEADLHRILLCSAMKTTLPKIKTKRRTGETFDNQVFFESNDFFLKNQVQVSEVLLSDPDSIDSLQSIYNKLVSIL